MIKWAFVLLFSFLNLSNTFTFNKMDIQPISESEVCNSNNGAFKAGEKLKYKIFYNWGLLWLAAGEVTFNVDDDDSNNYLYTAVGKSYKSYNWIFEVDDFFYSYVDKNTLLPNRAMRDINEDGYIIHNDIEFDQDEKNAVSTVIVNDKDPKIVEKDYDYCMYDILSVIYSLRNVDKSRLNIGDQIPFTMMLDDEVYPLSMEYIGKVGKTKVKNLGNFNAVKISPSVIKGRVFAKDERMKVWISDDKNNVPLIIESPLAVGKIKVILQEHEGLRYPLVNLD